MDCRAGQQARRRHAASARRRAWLRALLHIMQAVCSAKAHFVFAVHCLLPSCIEAAVEQSIHELAIMHACTAE